MLIFDKILGYVDYIHYINSMIEKNKFTEKVKKRTNLKYNHNDDYFDSITTANKAYILGFIIADGCINKTIRGNCITNRLTFNNSIDDFSVIDKIKDEISPESKVYIRESKSLTVNRKKQVSLRITSFALCEKLISKYDIIPNKTKHHNFQFNFDLIPKEFYRDFIRGFFDGDGSVSFYKTKNTIFFNFSFIFNSKIFAEQIGNIFEQLFNIKSVYYEHVGKTCTYYTLRFNYNRQRTAIIKEIYDYLYNNCDIYLERKQIKFSKYFEYRAKTTDNTVEQCNA